MNELTRRQAVQDKLEALYREAQVMRLTRRERPQKPPIWRWPSVWPLPLRRGVRRT